MTWTVKVLRHKFIWLFALVFLIAAGVVARQVVSSRNVQLKKVAVNTKIPAVLGSNYNAPRIIVTGGREGYSAGGMIALASTDEPSVTVATYDGSSGDAEVSLYQADEDAVITYLLHDKDGKQIQKDPDTSRFQFVTTLTHHVETSGNDSRVVLPLSETGIWYLKISYAGSTNHAFIVRSRSGVLLKEGDNEFIFWGQDFSSRRSISSGNLTLYNLQDDKKSLGEVSFGSDGVAKSSLSPEADIAVAKVGDDIAIIPINLQYLNSHYTYKSFVEKSRATRFFIFTDRPIYRPGDTVYFKSVLRDDDDARYTIPQGTATVKVFKDWDEKNTVFEKTVEITSEGTVFGEFTIPAESGAGYYQLKLALPGLTQPNYWSDDNTAWWTNSVGFQVELYRKPEYSIDVNAPQQEYLAGDTLAFTISGSYFSGQPLSGQSVQYSVNSGDFYEYEYRSEQPVRLSDEYRYGYWGGKKVADGQAVFNSRGEAVVEVPLTREAVGTKTQVFSIEAQFDDGSGNPSFSRKNVLVYPGQYGILREDQKSWAVKVGTELTIGVSLVPRVKTTVSRVKLTTKVHRENWVSYQEEGKKYPSYRKEEEDVTPLTTTTDGNGKASLVFTPQKVGSYTLTVSGKDEKGNTIEKAFYEWVTDRDVPVYTGEYHQPLTIQPSQKKYQPSDMARFTLYSDTPDRDIFFSLDRARVERFQIVHLAGSSGEVDIPLTASDMPNVYANAMSFSSSSLDRVSINVPVSAASKRLSVTLIPNATSFAPGETVSVNVKTTDASGNPVSADNALWAVDKALFELVDARPEKIFDRFWNERSDSTRDAHSLEGITVLTAEGGGCFAKGTLVLMGNGTTKEIEDVKIGDTILSRKGENDPTLVAAKVTGTRHAVESGYMIINGNLRVTADHILWVNGNWKEAGSIQRGDTLLASTGQDVAVTSVEWQAGKYDVYNLKTSGSHTYFADGVWVHNQKGGGGARTVFKDTAYWNPSVRTDETGQATVSFKLPDNLTTWVIAAVGDTSDTKVGQTTSEIVVTKSVIVRPTVSNLLRIGDSMTISSLVHNYTNHNETFDVTLTLSGADVTPVKHEAVQIATKSFKELFWKVTPKEANEKAKLTVSAVSKSDPTLGDTVVQELPIEEFGFYEKHGQSGDGAIDYPISLAKDSDPAKSTFTLSLSPTMIGTLPSAMGYLVDYPYGCVEQTTSRFVPAVIAKANLGLFADALEDKDLDSIIAKGVKRLGAMQRDDGGWTWWGTGKSDPYVTAYVVEYLLLAKANGITVPEDILSKAKTYVENNVRYTADYQPRTLTPEEDVVVGYATKLLDPTKTVFNHNYDKTDKTTIQPDLLAITVLLNAANGDKNPETNGLSVLVSLAKTQGNEIFWEAGDKRHFGSREASTALAIRAILVGGGDRDKAVTAARFLVRNRKFDYWSNTYGTAQVVRAITELVKTGSESSPNYAYRVLLDGEQIASGSVTDATKVIKDIVVPTERLKKQGSVVGITKEGDGQVYSTLVTREFRTDKKVKAQSHGLTLDRTFTNEKGEEYTLGVGDTVLVRLTVNGLKAPEYYGVIEDFLPSGLIPVNEHLKNEQFSLYDPKSSSYDVTDGEVTQNGMILSIYELGSGVKTYSYRARVIAEGDFLVPPATVSLMYTPEITGRTGATTLHTTDKSQEIPQKVLAKKVKNFEDSIRNHLITVLEVSLGFVILLVFFLKVKRFLKKRADDSMPEKPNVQDDTSHDKESVS